MAMSGYEYSRVWFDYAFENQGEIQPVHTALFFWIIEKFNRFGWVDQMSFPASEAMAAVGVSHNTYRKAFEKLVELGAIDEIKKSQNQFIACVIAIPKNGNASGRAIGKATGKPLAMLLVDQLRYNKTNKPINQEPRTIDNDLKSEIEKTSFDDFWNLYPKKVGKQPAEQKWDKLKQEEKEKAMAHVPMYAKTTDRNYFLNPATYIFQKRFNDEIVTTSEPITPTIQKPITIAV